MIYQLLVAGGRGAENSRLPAASLPPCGCLVGLSSVCFRLPQISGVGDTAQKADRRAFTRNLPPNQPVPAEPRNATSARPSDSCPTEFTLSAHVFWVQASIARNQLRSGTRELCNGVGEVWRRQALQNIVPRPVVQPFVAEQFGQTNPVGQRTPIKYSQQACWLKPFSELHQMLWKVLAQLPRSSPPTARVQG